MKAHQKYQKLTDIEIRKKCREFATECIMKQKKEFKRWGVLGDWDNHYETMDSEYESLQLEIFLKMFLDGSIYRGFRPGKYLFLYSFLVP
jgi:isoleucyl-tRNA synthetase